VVNNGVAHRRAGLGQVGAGLTRLPVAPFVEASATLAQSAGGADIPGPKPRIPGPRGQDEQEEVQHA